MCLIVAARYGKLDEESIRYAYLNNDDGAGFAYAKNNHIIIEKGFFDVEELIKSYNEVPDYCPHILHFRKTSKGTTNAYNCHPFLPHPNIAFAHNGTLSSVESDINFSDTYNLSSKILTDIFKDEGVAMMERASFQWLITEAMGRFNKLAFLTNQGRILIINEDATGAHWDCTNTSDIWYSNYSYMFYTTPKPVVHTPQLTLEYPKDTYVKEMPKNLNWTEQEWVEYLESVEKANKSLQTCSMGEVPATFGEYGYF